MAGETAAVLNTPEDWTYQGKTYKLRRRTFSVEAEFERFCARKQREMIRGQQEYLNALEYEALLEGWRRDAGAFAFSWGQPCSLMTLFSVPGQKQMAFLRLADANRQPPGLITPDLVEQIYQDKTVLRQEPVPGDSEGKLRDVTPWDELVELMARLDNPNRPAPQEGAQGAAPAST